MRDMSTDPGQAAFVHGRNPRNRFLPRLPFMDTVLGVMEGNVRVQNYMPVVLEVNRREDTRSNHGGWEGEEVARKKPGCFVHRMTRHTMDWSGFRK